MSNSSLSKLDMRSTLVVFTVAVMVVASFGLNTVDGATSPVTITSDMTNEDIMVGEAIIATLTLTSSDNKFRTMEVYLQASFDSGIAWSTLFMDDKEKTLPGNVVALDRQGTKTVKLVIYCTGVCEAGDTNTVTVYGKSDPRWYPGGKNANTCGSSDCETDTNPSSNSDNLTNEIKITLTARTGGSHSLTCETAHDGGDNVIYQSEDYKFKYELENTGWNNDKYNFVAVAKDAGGQSENTWNIIAGLSDNKELTGQSDKTDSAVHKVEALMTVTAASDARPGVYTLALEVTSSGGNVEGCEIQIVIPEPDLEVLVTDIDFSHSSAWINARGDSQRVTITATVRNNGGTVDAAGVAVENVEVVILVDGSQLGSVQTISALAHDQSEEVSAFWNPSRAHTGDEVGIPIKVSVDPDVLIKETDTDNNIASTHFKVVQTKASNPSFYMSFLSLIGAVGAAVLMSAYYRNRDSEE